MCVCVWGGPLYYLGEGGLQVIEAVAPHLQVEHDDRGLCQCLKVKLDFGQMLRLPGMECEGNSKQ